MSRFLLALRCFLAVLFTFRLPVEALKLLPAPETPTPEPAPEPRVEPPVVEAARPIVEVKPPEVEAPAPPPKVEAPPPAAPAPDPKANAELRRRGAVQLLAILQREGRLLDFLMEDIAAYSDAQIGAAVRDIHKGCRRGLDEHLQVAAIRPEPDEAAVRVDAGYDPSRVRLIGNLVGKPPFHGTLRHHGWAARNVTLPDLPESHDPLVINPAEVELG